MSFGRAKITRFNDRQNLPQKESQTSGISKPSGKTEKWAPPKSTRNPPLIKPAKPRSLSHPSSATAVNTKNVKSPRPRSTGDESRLPINKANPVQKSSILEQREGEEEDELEFKSATVLKNCGEIGAKPKDEHERKSACGSVTGSDKRSVNNDGEAVKASISGIPLRIKPVQASTKVTKPGPTLSPKQSPRQSPKPSPRIAKTASHVSTVSSVPKSASISKASLHPELKKAVSTERRTLETQFQTRKKRLDLMKKELFVKQKLVKDSYHVLVQLKKKLEESGNTNVVLEDLGLEEGAAKAIGEPNRLEDVPIIKQQPVEIDPEIVTNMKEIIKDIPLSLIEICKHLMTKRLVLLDTLEKLSDNSMDQEDAQLHIKLYHDDSTELEKMLEEKFSEQDKHVNELVEKWQALLKISGDTAAVTAQVETLQNRLKQQELKIATLTNDLQHADQLHEQKEKKFSQTESLVSDLKEKVKLLEHELNHERSSIQNHKDKYSTNESKLKTMKSRMQELETKMKENEAKYNEAQKSYRHAQEQLKASEHRWSKEKEELVTKSKHDRQMLDKLSKDRSFFEARVKSLEKSIEDADKKQKSTEAKLREELSHEKKMTAEAKAKIGQLQEQYDGIKEQLAQMEMKDKQAVDVIKPKHATFEPSETDDITTDREAELYTELLATRVALKAAEDQIQNYNREKLRFIDSIQMLQGDPEKDHDTVAKTLIKNVEKITELESRLTESDEAVCNQKIEIANLLAEIDNLRQRAVIPVMHEDAAKDSDLKLMLHEGKIKLEQSLKKSLDYEHKIIRYEHDLNKQSKQIYEMENLLKVRDGLISMMKAKKDELQMENDSLNKYANEIRELLIQAKEESRNRTELVQELTVNLDTRGRICQQLEKKVKELEGSLSATNEKRFKLQDTIGAMEKELQSTKAHIINMSPDIQSRVRLKSNRKW